MQSNSPKPLLRDKLHTRNIALGLAAVVVCLGGYIMFNNVRAASEAVMNGAGVNIHIQTDATGLVALLGGLFLAAVVVVCDRLGRGMKYKADFAKSTVEFSYFGMQHQRQNMDKVSPLVVSALELASSSNPHRGENGGGTAFQHLVSEVQTILDDTDTVH